MLRRQAGGFPRLIRRHSAFLLLAVFVLPLAGGAHAYEGAGTAVLFPFGRFDAQIAVGFAFFVGIVIFSATTAILYVRERRHWTERERALSGEIVALAGANDRADILIGAERQVVITWAGPDEQPAVDGDPTVAGEDATKGRLLAFGSWIVSADATALERNLDQLRRSGSGFRLALATAAKGYIEAEGRTVGGRALLRLRDVTGDRLELMRTQEANIALRADLDTARGLLETVPQPAWLRDREGRLAWVNRAYCAAVEASGVAEVKARALELLDQTDRAESQRLRREDKPFEARVAAIVAGTRRVLDVYEAPLSGASGGMALDVSELEAARGDRQRQMQAHVRMLDQLPTAVAMFDAKQRLVFHNAAYRELWKLDHAFLDQTPTDGVILDRLRAEGKLPEQADFRVWKADMLGLYRAVEPQETWWHLPDRRTLRVVTNPDPQGGLTYLYDDVSERVHLESRYNALSRVQRETLDTLTEGVALFGSNGRLKLSNQALLDIWRLPPEVAGSEPHIDALVDLCRPLNPDEQQWAEISGVVAGLRDVRIGYACRMVRRDGTVLESAAQPLPDGATLLTFIDVTASVNVERALTERNDALERAGRLRNEFVHHVSYELRSPLTNIIGFTQLLGDETVGALNARQREYAGHIMRSSGALLTIINDILDLASIDTDEMELEAGEVDIVETIRSAAKGIEDRLVEASLTLEIDAPKRVGSFIADGRRVQQVLFNLLSNAAGFSAPGQTIRVKARKRAGEVVFQVIDEGSGIPADVQERVFERFESHAGGSRHRGVGLGLSMVRSFVELHGGHVELVSAPGQGTTVTCTFPDGGGGASRKRAA